MTKLPDKISSRPVGFEPTAHYATGKPRRTPAPIWTLDGYNENIAADKYKVNNKI